MEVPGHIGWPITGDKTWEFAVNPISFIQNRIKEYHSKIFQSRLLNKVTVLLVSNKAVKEVLEDKSGCFEMGYKDFGYMHSLFGDLLLFENGDNATRLKTLLHTVFDRQVALAEYMQQVSKICSQCLGDIGEDPVAIYPMFKKLATQLSLSLFFDIDCEETSRYVEDIVKLTITHWHGLISVPMNLRYIGVTTGYGNALEAKDELLKIILTQLAKSDTNRFLQAMKDAGFESKGETARHILLFSSALLPKALSALMVGFCIEMAKPENVAYYERACSDEAFLDCVLLETIRLYPAFLGGRRVTRKAVVIDGYRIPKGYSIAYFTRFANRDPDIFPDGEDFMPDRWQTYNSADRDKVFTFGSGPRACIGRNLVHQILTCMAQMLLKNYVWHLEEDQNLRYKWLPVARPREDVLVTFSHKNTPAETEV